MLNTRQTIEKTFREESGRVIAALMSYLGDLELAQDALQDALIVALERWPLDGLPDNPGAWLTTAAKRKAIDRVRRDINFAKKTNIIGALAEWEASPEELIATVIWGVLGCLGIAVSVDVFEQLVP